MFLRLGIRCCWSKHIILCRIWSFLWRCVEVGKWFRVRRSGCCSNRVLTSAVHQMESGRCPATLRTRKCTQPSPPVYQTRGNEARSELFEIRGFYIHSNVFGRLLLGCVRVLFESVSTSVVNHMGTWRCPAKSRTRRCTKPPPPVYQLNGNEDRSEWFQIHGIYIRPGVFGSKVAFLELVPNAD